MSLPTLGSDSWHLSCACLWQCCIYKIVVNISPGCQEVCIVRPLWAAFLYSFSVFCSFMEAVSMLQTLYWQYVLAKGSCMSSSQKLAASFASTVLYWVYVSSYFSKSSYISRARTILFCLQALPSWSCLYSPGPKIKGATPPSLVPVIPWHHSYLFS